VEEDTSVSLDPSVLIYARRQQLIEEADHERLLAQLPGYDRGPHLRRGLAIVCHRLANWLDGSNGYVSLPESGPAYWVPRSARV
jgi:hypothetical protein